MWLHTAHRCVAWTAAWAWRLEALAVKLPKTAISSLHCVQGLLCLLSILQLSRHDEGTMRPVIFTIQPSRVLQQVVCEAVPLPLSSLAVGALGTKAPNFPPCDV